MAAQLSRSVAAALPDYRVTTLIEAVYLGTVILGRQVLLPLLLLVCWVKKLNRHPTLLNFLA